MAQTMNETPSTAGAAARPGRSPRDPRLDFFRGLAMLIIMIAHIQWNFWANWIPARFGPSDAAEMFVFCSGYAAAIAFGGTFARVGFGTGCARILLRCWQIWWAHLGLFFFIAMICVVANAVLGTEEKNYITALNLTPFFDERTGTALVGLFTLTYVPNYFDILPMYIAILLMTPIVVGLQRLDRRLAIAFCVGLYVATWTFDLHFPAEPWSDRPWFFNPLGWQLLFFTGFMLARGWIAPPPFDRRLVIAAAVFVVVLIPISRWQIYTEVPALQAIHDVIWVDGFKTNHHILRWLHILALAYLALWLLEGRRHWLTGPLLRPVVTVGQQALATFMSSMAVAWILTIVLDQIGRTTLTVSAINILGLASVVAVAYIVSWYKSEPWRRQAAAPAPTTEAPARGASPEITALAASRGAAGSH